MINPRKINKDVSMPSSVFIVCHTIYRDCELWFGIKIHWMACWCLYFLFLDWVRIGAILYWQTVQVYQVIYYLVRIITYLKGCLKNLMGHVQLMEGVHCALLGQQFIWIADIQGNKCMPRTTLIADCWGKGSRTQCNQLIMAFFFHKGVVPVSQLL